MIVTNKKFVVKKGVPPGACEQCAVKHDPSQPHNQQSLYYQYLFYEKHNHWPTWKDAMSHCPDAVQAHWKAELAKRGITV